MYPSFTAILMLLNFIFLSSFAWRRYQFFKDDRSNWTNYCFCTATFYISVGLFFYSLTPLLFGNSPVLPYGTALATIFNALGFAYFIMLPIQKWLSFFVFRAAQVALFGLVILIAALLLIQLPGTFIDEAGVIHWRFSAQVKILMFGLETLASIVNVIFLISYFNYLHRFYLRYFILLGGAFILTALGGGYLYIGDNSLLLGIAPAILLLGIVMAFSSIGRPLFPF